MEIWKCNFCGKELPLKNKYTKSGHLAGCKEWARRKAILTKEYLEIEYVQNQKSAKEIALNLGIISAQVVIIELKKYNIPVRGIVECNNVGRKQQKTIETCYKKYGCKNILAYDSPVIKKYKSELMEKYGVDNPFQVEEYKQKIKKTCMEKYGFESAAMAESIKEKQKKTMMEKYGVEHALQHPEICKKAIEKGMNTRIEKYGTTICGNSQVKSLTRPHKIINYFLDEMGIKYENEVPIGWFSADIVVENNKVIEVYGDYWHCNPRLYKAGDLVKLPSEEILVETKWAKDEHRKKFILDKGYDMLIIWEYDIYNNVEEVKKTIWDYIKSKK